MSDGSTLLCKACNKCEFDNSKSGKESHPVCTKYINFLGFMQGQRIPIILSFSRTNYNEGKKMYSLAKVTMQNMWNYGYKLDEKLQAKGNNEWYNLIPSAAGPTSEEDRVFGMELYKTFRHSLQSMEFDLDDTSTSTTSTPTLDNPKY